MVKNVAEHLTTRPLSVPFSLYLVTDRTVCGSDKLLSILSRLAASLPYGTLAVQLREKDLCVRDLTDLAQRTMDVLEPHRVPLLINDRLDVAMAIGAQGIHLPGTGLSPVDARRLFKGLIGISTHSVEQVSAADPGIVNFCTFGPVFDTPSKRAYGPPQGVLRLQAAIATARIPVFAIGGISARTVMELAGHGAAGIALIRAVLEASDPVSVAGEMLSLGGWSTEDQRGKP